MIRPALLLVCFCFLQAASRATAAAESWRPLTWHGERALVSDSHGRSAIVSLERGRLLHFGLTDREANTLLAPPTRAQRNYWGGHRLWLGPQSTWGTFWPPPDAWEYLGAESFTAEAGVLRLVMPDAGEGWPRLRRTYQWDGPNLVCGAELRGGTRPAQIIQILQLPATARVRVVAQPEPAAPAGYVLLPAGGLPAMTAIFETSGHVTPLADHALALRHINTVLKPGFRPQTLVAQVNGLVLQMQRGHQSGRPVAEPDSGFFTQVYLGGPEPFIEVEQLSPTWSPAEPAACAIILSVEPAQTPAAW